MRRRRNGRTWRAALAALGVSIFLPSCAAPPALYTGGRPLADAWSYAFICQGGSAFSARNADESLSVNVDGRRIELAPSSEAPGTFSGEGYALILRDEGSTLTTPAGARTGCTRRPADDPWEDAELRGVHYRAVGQEPGWYVEVTPGRSLLYVGDYGVVVVLADAPRIEVDSVRSTTRVTASSGGTPIDLTVTEGPCFDTMSGEGFHTRSFITVGSETLQGCGRWLNE